MRDDTREVVDLILGCDRFSHVFLGRYVYVANEINHLTGVCAPSVRGVMGETRVDYDLLLVVVSDLAAPLQSLKDSVAARKFLALPKTVAPAHSLDMLALEGRLSDWLVAEMESDLGRYTLGAGDALDLIRNGDDRFIWKLKQVFGDRFHQEIEGPLAQLV